MMTWRSATSGRASSCNVRIDCHPTRAAATARARTRNRWRAEKLIRRSIMPARIAVSHPAFGVEQEVARHHDGFARIESVDDLHAIAEAPSGGYGTRLENAFA